jgi:nitrate reductase gamma subunit
MPVPQILLYAATLFFIGAIAVRATRYARHPVHLRWELYPVAHERGRASYGGSHYEVPDQWTQPRRPDRLGEVRAMAGEILQLDGVRRHNRPLWRVSLPFHLGAYLIVVWLLSIMVAGAVWHQGVAPQAVRIVIGTVGWAGLALGLGGCVGLLVRRLTDPALRTYNAPADLFNLALWLAYLGWTALVHLQEGGFGSLVAIAGAMWRLQPAVLDAWVAVELILGAVLLAYLPLSRMFHFVAKYFLYHDVRWEDAPNPRGGPLERRLALAMDFGVAWSAPHTAAARTWAEAATGSTAAGRPDDQEQG